MFKQLYLLFFFGAALLYSLANWSLPLIDRDEPRFAEASREMRRAAISCYQGSMGSTVSINHL